MAKTLSDFGISFSNGKFVIDHSKEAALKAATDAELQQALKDFYTNFVKTNQITATSFDTMKTSITSTPAIEKKAPYDRFWTTAASTLDATKPDFDAKAAPKPDGTPKPDPKADKSPPVKRGHTYKQPTDPVIVEQIRDLQRFQLFLQDGDYAPIKGMELSPINGQGGKTTGNPMVKVSGRTAGQLWGMTEKSVVDIYTEKAKNDQAFRDALLAGLTKRVDSNPADVRAFLTARGVTIPSTGAGNEKADLTAAIGTYRTSLGAPAPSPDPKLTDRSRLPQGPVVPTDPYAGINFRTDFGLRRVDGDYVRTESDAQSDGIDKKGLHSQDKAWQAEHAGDPAALRLGVLTFGDGGKLYLTNMDDGKLIRSRVDDYIQSNGMSAFAKTPFRLDGEKLPQITNAFEALSERQGFDPKVGMLLKGPGYSMRVFQGTNGMEIAVVNPDDPAAKAARAQTPETIQTQWCKDTATFRSKEKVTEIINGSGMFRNVSLTRGPGAPPLGADFKTASLTQPSSTVAALGRDSKAIVGDGGVVPDAQRQDAVYTVDKNKTFTPGQNV